MNWKEIESKYPKAFEFCAKRYSLKIEGNEIRCSWDYEGYLVREDIEDPIDIFNGFATHNNIE